MHFGSSFVLKNLARFTGATLLHDLSDFLGAFQGMYEGFKERAAATKAMLAGPNTGFVLVTSPHPQTIDEAVFFAQELSRSNISVTAAIVNRVHEEISGRAPANDTTLALALARARIRNDGQPFLSERLARTLNEFSVLAQRDARQIVRFQEATGKRFPLYYVPLLERDVHDLASLWLVNEALRNRAS
jgi:hypothetical protein